jgi:hypothetical protein
MAMEVCRCDTKHIAQCSMSRATPVEGTVSKFLANYFLATQIQCSISPKKGTDHGLTTPPFPSRPILKLLFAPPPFSNNCHRCAMESPIMAMSRHGAHCAGCRDVANIRPIFCCNSIILLESCSWTILLQYSLFNLLCHAASKLALAITKGTMPPPGPLSETPPPPKIIQ